jgi:hypothetical protein
MRGGGEGTPWVSGRGREAKTIHLIGGTDPSDPADYPGKAAVTTTPSPAPTALATPPPTMTATPLPTPASTLTPASTPTPTEPGFEAVFATIGLIALTCMVRRTRWKK